MINRLATFQKISQYSDVYVVLAVILIVVMMVIPLPTILLDIFFACNISLVIGFAYNYERQRSFGYCSISLASFIINPV